ncbi:MAG: hypothetical protein LBG99_06845 [Propionibacteriaceae bacterium]|jgi:hypothetical protein|nr:hypothetical protein [Propionibacteriaceae bacterium]
MALATFSRTTAVRAIPRHEVEDQWVPAAPFRAHVSHLVTTAQIPWPVVAHKAGVSLGTLRTLLYGRNGRVRPKISIIAARSLIELRMEDLRWMRGAQMSAEKAGMRIRRLRSLGITWEKIAHYLTVDVCACQELARGERTSCSVMVDVLSQCACSEAGLPSWQDFTDGEDLLS